MHIHRLSKVFISFSLFFVLSSSAFCEWKFESNKDSFTDQNLGSFKLQADKNPKVFLVLEKLSRVIFGKVVLFEAFSIQTDKQLGNLKIEVAIRLDDGPLIFEEWPVSSNGSAAYSIAFEPKPYYERQEAVFSIYGMNSTIINLKPLLESKSIEIRLDSAQGVLKYNFKLAGLKEAILKNPGFFTIKENEQNSEAN